MSSSLGGEVVGVGGGDGGGGCGFGGDEFGVDGIELDGRGGVVLDEESGDGVDGGGGVCFCDASVSSSSGTGASVDSGGVPLNRFISLYRIKKRLILVLARRFREPALYGDLLR